MIKSDYLVKPGEKIDLDKFDTSDKGQFKDKQEALEPTRRNIAKLEELQEVLYADQKHALLIVFQAMDAGGKDGAIRHVFSGVNPQGCSVISFKVPSHEELAHDYLWRIHAATPRRGMIGIFNRSHYESVLVERVHKLVPEHVWEKRFEHINHFERLLSDEGTTILKFFLHISKKEQKQRLQARLDDKIKNWKFEPNDLRERELWDKYAEAYTEALAKCSTADAPWFIVPSNHKWFRNWVISDTIVQALEGMNLQYPKPVEGVDRIKIK